MSKCFRLISSAFQLVTNRLQIRFVEPSRFSFTIAEFSKLITSFITALICSFSIANHIFRFWGRSLPVQISILTIFTVILGVFFFLVIHNMSGLQFRQNILQFAAPVLLFTLIFWLFYEKVPVPAMPSTTHNTLQVTVNETSDNQEVILLEVQVGDNVVPFSSLTQTGDWTNQLLGDYPSVLIGHSPAELLYQFTSPQYRKMQLLFLKGPNGGKATLRWHGQSQTINLSNKFQDELLVTFSTTNNLMLTTFIILDILTVIILLYIIFFLHIGRYFVDLRQYINQRYNYHLHSCYPIIVTCLSVLFLIGIWNLWVTNSIFRDTTISDFSLPQFGDYRLVYNHTKDRWLFEGLDQRMLSNIQSADVIVTGSSLCHFALQSEEIHTYFNRNGVKYYNLCIPGSNDKAITEIISNLDLHPKLLILFYDYVSFDNNFDPMEPEISSRWKWADNQRDIELGLYFRHYFHQIFPYIPNYLYQREGISFGGPAFPELIFRNRDDGHLIYIAPERHIQVITSVNNYRDDTRFKPEHFSLARQLQSVIDQQKIPFAITSIDVNQGDFNLGTASEWANILNVPMIFPDITDLPASSDSLDGAHYLGEGAKIIGLAYAQTITSHLNMINNDHLKNTSQPTKINDLTIRQLYGGWKTETIQTIESSGDYLENKVDLSKLNDQNMDTFWKSPDRAELQSEYLLFELKDHNTPHRLRWITGPNAVDLTSSYSTHLDSFQIYTDDITWYEAISEVNFPVTDGKWTEAYLYPKPTNYLSMYYNNRLYTDKEYSITFSEVKIDRFDSNASCNPGTANFEIQLTSPSIPEEKSGKFVYNIRWSAEPILNESDWEQAHRVQSALPIPSPADQHDSFILEIKDLPPDLQKAHFAIRLVNNFNDTASEISNDFTVQNLTVCPKEK